MKIALTGSHGLIGHPLKILLQSQGHQVISLVRQPPTGEDVFWNPDKKELNPEELKGVEVIIHLAGENIANKRWSKKQKEYLLNNRKNGVVTLRKAIEKLHPKPKVAIFASAIGYYGDAGQKIVDETSPKGKNFASKICAEIEKEAQKLPPEVRVVTPRIGIVLSKKGGALAKMLPAFKLGLGGAIHTGQHYMSWIDINDVTSAFLHVISHTNLEGPVNFTSPTPCTNKVFSQTLAKVLNRPCFLPMPKWVVKFLFGQMGEELLLASAAAHPKKLQQTGFKFEWPNLHKSLKDQLKS